MTGRLRRPPPKLREHLRHLAQDGVAVGSIEVMDAARDYHAFWKLYGMDLPDDVLRKLYYGNALRIIPRMPTEGFPES